MSPELIEERRSLITAASFGVSDQRQATLTRVLVSLFDLIAGTGGEYFVASWSDFGEKSGINSDTFRGAIKELERDFAVVGIVDASTRRRIPEFAELRTKGKPGSNAYTIHWDRIQQYAEKYPSEVPAPRPGGLYETEHWDGHQRRILLENPLALDIHGDGRRVELSDYLREAYQTVNAYEAELVRRFEAAEISRAALDDLRYRLACFSYEVFKAAESFSPSLDAATID
jgi:hypothetical protein